MIRQYNGEDLEKVLVYFGLINASEFLKVKIVCPFHGDINPSLSVDFVKGRFYCFGCGLKGDVFDFVKYVYPELSDLEVVLKITEIVNSNDIKKLNIKKKKKEKINLKQSLIDADNYFFGLSVVDWNVVKTQEQSDILAYMKKRGFSQCDLNVGNCRVSSNVDYPIIFPILDNGAFCGYVCRTMDKKVETYRKYLYNKGFKKRYTLCGTYEKNSLLVVCEGFLDYLSFKTRGHVKNVVALLGWHASDIQIEKIKKCGIKTIVCALDNPEIDESGKKGLCLLEKHFNVIAFPYPKNIKDAGDMTGRQIREGMKKVNETYFKLKNGNEFDPQNRTDH